MQGSASQWFPVICHGIDGGESSVTTVRISLLTFRWNDNRPASSHIPRERFFRVLVITRLRAFAISLGALITVGATAGPLGAQSTTSLLPDAALLPRGEIRLRVLSGFTRYDELLDGSDTLASPRNLAADMQRPMLGTAEIPLLIPAQSAIQTLLGEPDFQISAGQMVATANSRVVTAPLVLEYGL